MIVRAIVAALLSLTMVGWLPGAASAATIDHFYDSNTYGWYHCYVKMEADKDRFQHKCSISDRECDGYGVYVGMQVGVGDVEGSWTGVMRVTDNAGGCGNGFHQTVYRTYKVGPGPAEVQYLNFRLCKDIPNAPDKCYKDTISSKRY